MAVTLTRRAPAFRIDDAALDRLWRALGAKCAEAGPPDGTLTVRETLRTAGRPTPEKHEHTYRSIDDLRRASNGSHGSRCFATTRSASRRREATTTGR